MRIVLIIKIRFVKAFFAQNNTCDSVNFTGRKLEQNKSKQEIKIENSIEAFQKSLALVTNTLGLSIEDWAKCFGVSRQTIYNITSGQSKMTKMQFIAFGALLDYIKETKELPLSKGAVDEDMLDFVPKIILAAANGVDISTNENPAKTILSINNFDGKNGKNVDIIDFSKPISPQICI